MIEFDDFVIYVDERRKPRFAFEALKADCRSAISGARSVRGSFITSRSARTLTMASRSACFCSLRALARRLGNSSS